MSLTWQHNYREHVLSTVDLTYRWKLCSALFMGLCRWTEAISHLVMLFLTSVGSWVGSSMFSTAQWCLHVFAQGIRGLPCQFNDKHVVEISLDGYLVFTWSAQWSTVNPGPWIKKPNGCLIGRVPFKYQIMTDYWRSIPPNYISTMVTINPGLTLRWNMLSHHCAFWECSIQVGASHQRVTWQPRSPGPDVDGSKCTIYRTYANFNGMCIYWIIYIHTYIHVCISYMFLIMYN